ncbi:hypothetical protein PHYBOEH_007415 [Phytophthora boehmeriae]|uniref:Agenet domain-containing protein n=1 Tax=Phytophthora boehmeriae TaxID=109152 RepID=A0A8T1WA16_9STRA|nr:hypothetical protein PHYBOEH_007415 [Phytophthora boehmeriae]
MAELSLGARLLLSLLLLAASFLLWQWLHSSPEAPQSSAKRSKKRSKKKSAKKSVSEATISSPEKPFNDSKQKPGPNTVTLAPESDEDDSSDDGLSAAQVLATRKFKPKSLGGTRLARKIKATLPTADAVRFAVGQEVLGRFGGGGEWFPATVLELRKGNEYHLKYDDGEVEYRVPAAFIKLRPSAKSDGEGEDEEAKGQVAESPAITEVIQSESDSSGSAEDDGWQVVGASSAAKRQSRLLQQQTETEPTVGGLTKRQRENRRKKERQREMKELLRQQAQKDDLDARARWRYAPSSAPKS